LSGRLNEPSCKKKRGRDVKVELVEAKIELCEGESDEVDEVAQVKRGI